MCDNTFKKYTNRLYEKFEINKANDINNMISFLNWCFKTQNNFFISNFNKKYVFNVCKTYSQIKTNILKIGPNSEIFEGINESELRRLKFILNHFVYNYDKISTNFENRPLTELISKESIKNCSILVSQQIKKLNNIKINGI